MNEFTQKVICFALGSFVCTVAICGALGIDPTVSHDTKPLCKETEALPISCKGR